MTLSNGRSFVTMAINLPSCFSFKFFRTPPEVSSKLYFVEICYILEKLWLFNHKRSDFWFPNFGFKRLLPSLLNFSSAQCNKCFLLDIVQPSHWNFEFQVWLQIHKVNV